MKKLEYDDWGLVPYMEAYKKQKVLFEIAVEQKMAHKPVQNTVIFCEHPHVITIGKHASDANLLFSEEILREKQVELFHSDRGGDITYHGQGQLVCYPIVDLEFFQMGLKDYIYLLEKTVINLLAEYNVKGEHFQGGSGVWIETDNPLKTRKICAIGVKSSRYVTMHGFALNISTDLDYFNLINPCGFKDKGVTSLQKELGREIDMNDVKSRLRIEISKIFT